MVRMGIGDIFLWAVFHGILMAIAGIITGLVLIMLGGGTWSSEIMGLLFFIGQVWGIVGVVFGVSALFRFNSLLNLGVNLGKAVCSVRGTWSVIAIVFGAVAGFWLFSRQGPQGASVVSIWYRIPISSITCLIASRFAFAGLAMFFNRE